MLRPRKHASPSVESKFVFHSGLALSRLSPWTRGEVRDYIASPERLEKLASASDVRDKFTIEALANQLQHLGATL